MGSPKVLGGLISGWDWQTTGPLFMHVGSLGILTPPLPSSAPAFNTIPGPGVPELPPPGSSLRLT